MLQSKKWRCFDGSLCLCKNSLKQVTVHLDLNVIARRKPEIDMDDVWFGLIDPDGSRNGLDGTEFATRDHFHLRFRDSLFV